MQESLIPFQAFVVWQMPAAGFWQATTWKPGNRPGDAERGHIFGAATGIPALHNKGASPSSAGHGNTLGGTLTAREHGSSADRVRGR